MNKHSRCVMTMKSSITTWLSDSFIQPQTKHMVYWYINETTFQRSSKYSVSPEIDIYNFYQHRPYYLSGIHLVNAYFIFQHQYNFPTLKMRRKYTILPICCWTSVIADSKQELFHIRQSTQHPFELFTSSNYMTTLPIHTPINVSRYRPWTVTGWIDRKPKPDYWEKQCVHGWRRHIWPDIRIWCTYQYIKFVEPYLCLVYHLRRRYDKICLSHRFWMWDMENNVWTEMADQSFACETVLVFILKSCNCINTPFYFSHKITSSKPLNKTVFPHQLHASITVKSLVWCHKRMCNT